MCNLILQNPLARGEGEKLSSECFLDSGEMGQGGRPEAGEAGEAQPKKFRV